MMFDIIFSIPPVGDLPEIEECLYLATTMECNSFQIRVFLTPKFRRVGRIIRSTMSQERLEFAIIGEYDIVRGEYFWTLCANFRANTGLIWSESRGKLYRGNHGVYCIRRIKFGELLGKLHWANYVGRTASGSYRAFVSNQWNFQIIFYLHPYKVFIT